MKRSPLKRTAMKPRSTPLARGTSELKRSPLVSRPKPRVATNVSDAPKLFWEAVCTGKPCAVCGVTQGKREAHHVTEAKLLKKLGLHDLLWAPENGMPLCTVCHQRHTNAMRRIPMAKVPIVALRFAESIGQLWRLERHYPGPYPAGWQPNTEGRT